MAQPLGDSVPLTGDPRIDVVTQGGSWGIDGGPHALTYSFNTVPGGAAWSAAAQAAVAQALDAWAAVANVSFSQLGSGGDISQSAADIAFGLSDGELLNSAGAVGVSGFVDVEDADPYRTLINAVFGTSYTGATYANPEGDIFIESKYPGFAYLQPGGDGLLTILHEIGHALGLKHPFDDGGNGRPTAIELGVPQYDDGLQTIMSYDFVSPYYGIGNQATPMPLDILAIQQIYGANMTYHTGDDTYVLADDGIVRTIWDAGGIDTFSAAGLASGAYIDLREGHTSWHGKSGTPYSVSGTAVAFNTSIEIAIGSKEADTIHGSDGDNTIDGNGGFDLLFGHLGNDTYFVRNNGVDVREAENEGIDTIITSIDLGLPENVETLILDVSAARGAGNALDNTIIGNSGRNVLDGDAGADTMIGGDGDDIYFVRDLEDVAVEQPDAGQDVVTSFENFVLGENIETLILADGVSGAGAIGTGNALSNQIVGNSANSILTGLAGDDTLQGNNGNDTLIGGLGDDLYFVDGTKDRVVENVGEGFDTVDTQVSFVLPDSIENLVLLPNLAANGTGNAFDNSIEGNDIRNTLIGNAGNDTLDGGGGVDKLVGGLGDDVYFVDVATDAITEGATAGHDTVHSTASYTLAANVEDLTLEGTALAGIGNASNNLLTGNGANNLLDGKAGADTMTGGDGDDLYIVDSAGDSVNELGSDANDELRTNQLLSGVVTNIEHYTFTGSIAVNFTADGAANRLTGTAKNDTLDGGAGDDTLNGGAGSDSLVGGIGNDTYIVDNAKDIVDESGGNGTDKVQSFITYVLAAGLENLDLLGSATINGTGNGDANDLTGNKGANKLDGMGGADTMAGGGGNDTYIVGEVGDQVIETIAGAAGGIDLVLSAVSFDLSLAGREQVEKLTLTGGAGDNINATGNGLSNTLTGNAGNNKLDGQGGADKMAGGLGNDIYVVDLKTDTVTEAAKAGTDTVQSFISYVLGVNLENLELQGLLNIDGTGNTADNKLTGNDGNNKLDGKAGADTMAGGLGNDTYVFDKPGDIADESGGGGTDTIVTPFAAILGAEFENLTLTGAAAVAGTGNALANVILGNSGANVLTGLGENDSLAGGAGNDSLDGGIGNDRVDGGTGADNLTGGAGDDTYIVDNAKDVVIELPGGGLDTVESSVSHILAAEVENLTLTGAGAINGTGNALANVIVGNTAANILSGGAENDTLDGGKGADKLTGGDGSDHFLHHSLADGKDTITDFHTGPGGDVLDISDLLVGYTAGHEAEFVQCVTAAGNTTVKVDADGLDNGAKFTDVCVLTGVTTDLGTLLADDNIVL